MEPFVYLPLPSQAHIRLLWVHADPHNGGLSFDLKCYSPGAVPNYYALSYCWGTCTSKDIIMCNERYMEIGATLHRALQNMYTSTREANELLGSHCDILHLDHKEINLEAAVPLSSEYPIWIDAICINQQDNSEKGHQVQFMGEIYKKAKLVVVWLGPSENNSNLAMNSITDLAGALKKIPYEPLWMELPLHNLPDQKHPVWAALGHFFRRKWFGRLWIFQEAVLATDILIVCGRKTIEWQPFSSFCEEMNRLNLVSLCLEPIKVHENGILATAQILLVKRRLKRYGKLHFAYFLQISDKKLATDPRDKVYGMLGIGEESLRDSIVVSYDDNTEEGILKTYIDCAKACIQSSNYPLTILQMVAGRSKVRGLPSWCPNFMDNQASACLSGYAGILTDQFTPDSAKILPNSNILSINGFRVDIVIEVIEAKFPFPIFSHGDDQLQSQEIMKVEDQCQKLARRTFISQDERIPLGHQLTLTANQSAQLSEAEAEILSQAYHDIFHHIRSLAESGMGSWPPRERLRHMYEFWIQMQLSCTGRRYFSTQGGRTGLGPLEMRVGDIVCVFYGSETLFILRPALGKEPDGWVLIGDAYVYGLMNLSETLKGERGEDEIFNLH